jgi:RNA polymerase sigma factor (sigma-70 family)
MQSTDDRALLRQYAENNSDEAFAALVTHHVSLVYSVALRQVGNPHHAEEITQAVFIILARKAAALRHDKALSSWLFQATRLTAHNFVRSESRRHRREEEAYMQSVLDEAGTEVWPKIAPFLDDAVANLREKDRRAILLRFYEGRNLREVGAVLGASEDAAEKRVNRALEKLRHIFAKRGVSSTTAIIAETISAHSVQAAPVALAKGGNRRGHWQRRGGFDFNPDPHQRSIENYGLDENENNGRCQRRNSTRRRNHGCGLGIKVAGGPQKRRRGL